MTSQPVSQLMRHPVVELNPDYDVASTLELSAFLGVHHFPLLRRGKLIGMVCTCDLDDAPRNAHICDFAQKSVVTVTHDTKVEDAARLMVKKTVGSAIVMDHGLMCGILTREDIERQSPELAAMFAQHRCEACGATKHLKRSPQGALLCAGCSGRAREKGWLETGGGD